MIIIYSFSTINHSLLSNLHELAFRSEFSDEQITPPTRKVYDFNKTLKERFLVFEDKEVGYAITYSSEMQKDVPSESESSVIFALVSQTQSETEVYDGLLIKIFDYENKANTLLNTINNMDISHKNELEWRKVDEIIVDGIKGWKITQCCYMGESYQYYFPTKKGEKYIRIDVYPNGPDREQYVKIIDKMINSIKVIKQ